MPDYSSRRPQFPLDRLAPTGLRSRIARHWGNVGLVHGLPVLLGLPFGENPAVRTHVPASFFGINLAPGLTSDHDNLTLERVRDLGIAEIRLDFPVDENENHRRLLRRLDQAGLRVLLHVVQSPRSAAEMGRRSGQLEWVNSLQDLIRREPGLCEVELGSTPNRYRFSGYTLNTLVSAIECAVPILEAHGIAWSVPGLSDFEPLFLAALFSLLSRRGLHPYAATCNLHVDRAGGPETYDPHVAGRHAGRHLRLDLTRKMEVLSSVARAYSIEKTYCSFFSWTLLNDGVTRRRYVSEQQQADYICRYLVMAAASGMFDRVFLGPLVSHSRGLMDGAPVHRSFPPAVVLNPTIGGDIRTYRVRPAYSMVQWLLKVLPGTQIMGRLSTPPRVHAFAFEGDDNTFWVAIWTEDGFQIELKPLSVQSSASRVTAFDRSGRGLLAIPTVIRETPFFLRLESIKGSPILSIQDWFQQADPGISVKPRSNSAPVRAPVASSRAYARFENARYRGVLARSIETLLPPPGLEGTLVFPDEALARRTRHGRIFRLQVEGEAELVQVKELPPSQLDLWGHSRAFREWSNLLNARKRNLSVPTPLGYLETRQRPSRHLSYILTVFESGATSLRELNQKGHDRHSEEFQSLYRRLGATIRNWHAAGAFHRDFSIGNLLVRSGRSDLLIVDLDRARFYSRLGLWRRLRDLARVRVPEAVDSEFLNSYFGPATPRHRILTSLFRRAYRAKLGARRRVRSILRGG